MKSTFIINKDDKKPLVKQQEAGFHTSSMQENHDALERDHVTIDNREILLDGIMMVVRHEHITQPLTVEVKHSFPYIKVQFEIEGYSNYTPANTSSVPVEIKGGQYNFFYLPEVAGRLNYKVGTRKNLEIIVTEEYLRNAFKGHFEKNISPLALALNEHKPFKMFEESEPIPSNLLLTIKDIIQCSYEVEIKEVYLESKVKEIFSLLLWNISKQTDSTDFISISDKEKAQILVAEKILRERFNKTITIKELSALTGINQSKLKRNFKAVFHEPIFAYLTSIRMEEAKKMLLNNCSVSEVAYSIGYKNPQHFTTAFKKKFGYLPSSLKS
ncbi:AraC family transcriptional regulator [Fulvivirga maritima]|uniref:helix-turn-helix domain-containing protein n=1 Tax=Fulvivirga maritima TaxID=2904247 RepID=UPI001F3CF3ED|nr:helix-turn-helix domain-containing protein [Fulvivirga maritima]UII25713.1 AraC family transcriptional regulator [Fulvivirga maritima]